jgi:hypothetical protein
VPISQLVEYMALPKLDWRVAKAEEVEVRVVGAAGVVEVDGVGEKRVTRNQFQRTEAMCKLERNANELWNLMEVLMLVLADRLYHLSGQHRKKQKRMNRTHNTFAYPKCNHAHVGLLPSRHLYFDVLRIVFLVDVDV